MGGGAAPPGPAEAVDRQYDPAGAGAAVLLVTLVSAGVSTFYYASMQDGLRQQAEALSSSFNDYFMNSYSEYNRWPPRRWTPMMDKSKIELQFISSSGPPSRCPPLGLTAGTSPGTSDITGAIANQVITAFHGRDLGDRGRT